MQNRTAINIIVHVNREENNYDNSYDYGGSTLIKLTEQKGKALSRLWDSTVLWCIFKHYNKKIQGLPSFAEQPLH